MRQLLVATSFALSLGYPTFAVAQEGPASQKPVPEQIVDVFPALIRRPVWSAF